MLYWFFSQNLPQKLQLKRMERERKNYKFAAIQKCAAFACVLQLKFLQTTSDYGDFLQFYVFDQFFLNTNEYTHFHTIQRETKRKEILNMNKKKQQCSFVRLR